MKALYTYTILEDSIMATQGKNGKFNASGKFLMRLPMSREGERVLDSIKQYINNDEYKLVVRYSGKRHHARALTTRKDDASSMRIYMHERHPEPSQYRHYKGTLTHLKRVLNADETL